MFSGFYSIVASFNSDYERAAWAIMIASIFDVLDGWVARMTHTATRFGIEIDSLSDVISFGVAPGILVYTWTLPVLRPARLAGLLLPGRLRSAPACAVQCADGQRGEKAFYRDCRRLPRRS